MRNAKLLASRIFFYLALIFHKFLDDLFDFSF